MSITTRESRCGTIKTYYEYCRGAVRSPAGLSIIELLAVLVILGLIAAIAFPMVSNVLGKAAGSASDSGEASVERAGEMAYTDGLAFDDRVGVGSGYRIDYLVDNGFLNVSEEDPLLTSKNYVAMSQPGHFTYNGPGMPTSKNNLLSDKHASSFTSPVGRGYEQVMSTLKPVQYTLNYDYELLEYDPDEGKPRSLLVYTTATGGNSGGHRSNGVSINGDAGHVNVTFTPGIGQTHLFVYGANSNRAATKNAMRFDNMHLRQADINQRFHSLDGVILRPNNRHSAMGSPSDGPGYMVYTAGPNSSTISAYTTVLFDDIPTGTQYEVSYEVWSPVDTRLGLSRANLVDIPAETWVTLTETRTAENAVSGEQERMPGMHGESGQSHLHMGDNGFRVRTINVRVLPD